MAEEPERFGWASAYAAEDRRKAMGILSTTREESAMSTGQQYWKDKEDEYGFYQQACKDAGVVPLARLEDTTTWEPHWRTLQAQLEKHVEPEGNTEETPVPEVVDALDAALLSGDTFEDPVNRAILAEFIERWQRVLNTSRPYADAEKEQLAKVNHDSASKILNLYSKACMNLVFEDMSSAVDNIQETVSLLANALKRYLQESLPGCQDPNCHVCHRHDTLREDAKRALSRVAPQLLERGP